MRRRLGGPVLTPHLDLWFRHWDRRNQARWSGVAASAGSFRFSLLWIKVQK